MPVPRKTLEPTIQFANDTYLCYNYPMVKDKMNIRSDGDETITEAKEALQNETCTLMVIPTELVQVYRI